MAQIASVPAAARRRNSRFGLVAIALGAAAPPILAAKAGDRDVVLEITEHEAITDYDSFRAAVLPMRDRVRIAVDDAGAGFASLRHIVELAPAMVKLDRSLVAGIADDPARRAVVDGMVKFAQTSDLILIAEGIETAAELATLRELGVPLGQGFLLGRPVAPPAARRATTDPHATTRRDQPASTRNAARRPKAPTKVT